MTERVVVVVVNWNSGPLLGRCVDALLHQTRPPDRIVVIDNASTDQSLSALGALRNHVDVIQNQRNIGFAAANNFAIQRYGSSYHWIALINPDAVPEPSWLESLLRTAHEYPEYAFFSSTTICFEPVTILDGAGDCYHVSGMVWRSGHGLAKGEELGEPREVFSCCAAAALYRSDAISSVGGFDERYFCYMEDVDLGFRLRLAGYRCLHVPQAVAYHIGGASSGGPMSDFTIYHGHRNIVWTYFKNMPGWLFWLYLPQHLLLNVLTLIWLVFCGRSRVILRAKVDAVRALPEVWKERRKIQERRRVDSRTLLSVMVRGVLAPYSRRGRRKLEKCRA